MERQPLVNEDRLTPACAGKTALRRWYRSAPTAHPRVCGENSKVKYDQEELEGSPPRVRGKQRKTPYDPHHTGLTPACAGKTRRCRRRIRWRSAHPRVCGENAASVSHDGLAWGSPPRVRGKPQWPMGPHHRHRLTPACAGKTGGGRGGGFVHGAHPRVCGENAVGDPLAALAYGSPPRVRGKPAGRHAQHEQPGLTPACAGKTVGGVGDSEHLEAHPRVCGENASHRRICCIVRGSPPRVRGKR